MKEELAKPFEASPDSWTCSNHAWIRKLGRQNVSAGVYVHRCVYVWAEQAGVRAVGVTGFPP